MKEKTYLKWYNKVGYGSGDIAGNVVYAFLSSFVMIYLTNTIGLSAGIVDARHKPTANDLTMHSWFRETGCPEIVVANKLDKLKKSQIEPALALIRETLELREEDVLLPFSAEKGTGKEELIRLLNAAIE